MCRHWRIKKVKLLVRFISRLWVRRKTMTCESALDKVVVVVLMMVMVATGRPASSPATPLPRASPGWNRARRARSRVYNRIPSRPTFLRKARPRFSLLDVANTRHFSSRPRVLRGVTRASLRRASSKVGARGFYAILSWHESASRKMIFPRSTSDYHSFACETNFQMKISLRAKNRTLRVKSIERSIFTRVSIRRIKK